MTPLLPMGESESQEPLKSVFVQGLPESSSECPKTFRATMADGLPLWTKKRRYGATYA